MSCLCEIKARVGQHVLEGYIYIEQRGKLYTYILDKNSSYFTAGNHVTQQQQWPIFEKNPWLQVRKSSIIPLIHDRLEFGLKQRRWKDSRDLLDMLDFLNNTWSKSYWRANKFFTLDNCLLVNNFFIRCCLKNLTHQANLRSPSAFSASNQIPIGHVLTELLKIFLPEVGGFFQMSVIVVVFVSRDSPPCIYLCRNKMKSHMKISLFGFHVLKTYVQRKW